MNNNEGHFTVSIDRLERITALVNKTQAMDVDDVFEALVYDWPEGQEHQDWLDSADVREIADWVLSVSL